jgi:hypothetical protein
LATSVAIVFVGGLALFLIAPAFLHLQADSFRDLYLGRWISAHGIPHHEAFAIANHGRPWIDQQWLADLLVYGTWKLSGYQGVAVVEAVTVASAYAVLAGVLRRRGASVGLAISFASFAMVSVFTLVFIRAQSLALPLFPVLMWLCVLDSEMERARWPVLLIVPVLALWSNLHGSVLIGAALASGYLCSRAGRFARARRWRTAAGYAVLAAAAALAVLATPYGTGILGYYHDFLGNHAVGAADLEWDPPAFPALSFFQFSVPLVLAATSMLIAWRHGRRPPSLDLWAVGLTVSAAALAMRNNVWLGMAASILIADTASAWFPIAPLRPGFVRTAAVAAVALSALGVGRLAFESSARFEGLAPQREVAAVAAYAASHPCSRVLADIMGVSVLLWDDPWMAGRVGFDGRIELYAPRALLAWVDFQSGNGSRARDLARRYQLLMASARAPALVRWLAELRTGSVLDRDPRGIAIVNRAAGSVGCGPAG